jgi:hypothetical protein
MKTISALLTFTALSLSSLLAACARADENRVEFNTPVLKNGLLIGLTGPTGSGAHQFFCAPSAIH